MPIDPSIALASRAAPFNNPFEVLAQMQQVKAQQQVINSNRALEDQRRQDISKQAREEEAQRRFFGILSTTKTPDEAESRIQAEAPELLGQFRENRLKLDKLSGEIRNDQLQAKKLEADRKVKEQEYLTPLLQMVEKSGYDPNVFDFALTLASSQFEGLPVDQLRAMATDPQRIKQLVDGFKTPQQQNADTTAATAAAQLPGIQADTTVKQQVAAGTVGGLTPDQQRQGAQAGATLTQQQKNADRQAELERMRIGVAERNAQRATASEPLETIMGPDGKPVRVPRSQAIGQRPASSTEKTSSGQQKRVLNFFNRAEQADKELEALEPEIQKLSTAGQARLDYAHNLLQTQTGQAYTAAQRAFTEARLRKDSGAAIPEHEYKNDRETYFAKAGDSAATLEQKRRARASILSSLAFESGQALGEFLGDPDEAQKLLDGYKQRASGSATSGKPSAADLIKKYGG